MNDLFNTQKEPTKKDVGGYQDGLKHGEWKSFYSCSFPVKSKLQSVGFYQHGIKHGKYVEYDKNGDIKSEDIFDNGQFKPTDKLGVFF